MKPTLEHLEDRDAPGVLLQNFLPNVLPYGKTKVYAPHELTRTATAAAVTLNKYTRHGGKGAWLEVGQDRRAKIQIQLYEDQSSRVLGYVDVCFRADPGVNFRHELRSARIYINQAQFYRGNLYLTMLHELGHIVQSLNHSEDENSYLFTYYRSDLQQHITYYDAKKLRMLYKR